MTRRSVKMGSRICTGSGACSKGAAVSQDPLAVGLPELASVRAHGRQRRKVAAKRYGGARWLRRARVALWPSGWNMWDPGGLAADSGSGVGDEVIMSLAGHVSRAMLSRYSHVPDGSEAARPRRDRWASVRGRRLNGKGARCGAFQSAVIP